LKIQKAFKYKLKKPSKRVKDLTKRLAGCYRFVSNKALALQKEHQEKGEEFYSHTDLANMLPVWKQAPAMAFRREAPSQCLHRR
jgi:putative transposase